ncbi:hypothetical protein V2N52_09050, partial [Streptococcus pneumoniae]
LKNAWTTSRQVNFFWVANFNLKFGVEALFEKYTKKEPQLTFEFLLLLIVRIRILISKNVVIRMISLAI